MFHLEKAKMILGFQFYGWKILPDRIHAVKKQDCPYQWLFNPSYLNISLLTAKATLQKFEGLFWPKSLEIIAIHAGAVEQPSIKVMLTN